MVVVFENSPLGDATYTTLDIWAFQGYFLFRRLYKYRYI